MVILLLGLNSRVPLSKTQKSGSTEEKYSRNDRFLTLIWVMSCSATGESSDSISSFEIYPVNSMIFSSWLRVLSPANIGFPIRISATIQPKLQTSMGFLYDLEPNSNSGARYHFVATYSERMAYSSR